MLNIESLAGFMSQEIPTQLSTVTESFAALKQPRATGDSSRRGFVLIFFSEGGLVICQ